MVVDNDARRVAVMEWDYHPILLPSGAWGVVGEDERDPDPAVFYPTDGRLEGAVVVTNRSGMQRTHGSWGLYPVCANTISLPI